MNISIIPCKVLFTGINVDSTCRNWTTNYDGGQGPMSCKAKAMRLIGEETSHLLGRYPRCWAWQAQQTNASNEHFADIGGSTDLYNWIRWDGVPNARTYTIRILGATAENQYSANANVYAELASNSDFNTGLYNDAGVNIQMCGDFFAATIEVNRGDPTNAEQADALNTYSGFTVVDMVIQDDELTGHDTSVHDWIPYDEAHIGETVSV